MNADAVSAAVPFAAAEWVFITMAALGFSFFLAIIYFGIRAEQKKNQAQIDLQRLAIEKGVPLETAEVLRTKFLGIIAIAVPLGCLGIATAATSVVLKEYKNDPSYMIAAIWFCSAVVAIGGLLIGSYRLLFSNAPVRSKPVENFSNKPFPTPPLV